MSRLALYVAIGISVAVGALVVLAIFGKFFEPQNDYCEFAEEYAIAVEGARTSREITDASVEFVSKVGNKAADPIPSGIRESAENLIDGARSAASGATPDLVGEKRTEVLTHARRMLQDCGMEPVVRINNGSLGMNTQPGSTPIPHSLIQIRQP
ncbi:MAG: hypothetical protein OXC95_05890 [Dehalococcoidia bacterium]|nr:hypothetical protein [Dehalococcoidia bacterium]